MRSSLYCPLTSCRLRRVPLSYLRPLPGYHYHASAGSWPPPGAGAYRPGPLVSAGLQPTAANCTGTPDCTNNPAARP